MRAARKESLKALNNASGLLRGEFARRAHLRVAPDLEFRFDEGIERGQRIFELLHSVEGDLKPTPPGENAIPATAGIAPLPADKRKRGRSVGTMPHHQYQETFDAILAAQRIVLAGHVNPDGDTLGCVLALCHLLNHLGKDFVPLSTDGVPDNLRWLAGIGLDSDDDGAPRFRSGDCLRRGRSGASRAQRHAHYRIGPSYY